MNEYYATVTRKLQPGLSRAEARVDGRALQAWDPVPVDRELILRAFHLEDAASLSWWGSLVVAAAWVGGCRFLLSEDLPVGQTIDGVKVLSPFDTEPGRLA